MKRKKIVNRVARIIRKHTKHKLPVSINIAKKFLKDLYCYDDNYFKYDIEWQADGIRWYYNWTGKIYAGKRYEQIDWEIPKELYDLKKIYKNL